MTHVNVLRTIEAMYTLPKSGAQQPNAVRAGITDDATAADQFVLAGAASADAARVEAPPICPAFPIATGLRTPSESWSKTASGRASAPSGAPPSCAR
jgi:hypothetical protein